MRVPIALFTTAGLIFGLLRFVSVLRAGLQNPPTSFIAILFLAAIVAGVALLIVLASAAMGLMLGMLLQLGYGFMAGRRLIRPTL